MPLMRESLNKEYIKLLTQINLEIDGLGKAYFTDIHTSSEVFFMQLLNLLYGFNLKDANSIKKNYPGIDLIDDDNKIVIQVTADYSNKKINKTLSSDVIEQFAQRGYTLKFCFIGNNTKKKNITINNVYNISFNPIEDSIIQTDLILAYQRIIDLDEKRNILVWLKKELGIEFKITDEFIKKSLSLSIDRLGPRYTPNANVETAINNNLRTFLKCNSFFDDINKLIKNGSKKLNRLGNENIYNDQLREIYGIEKKIIGKLKDYSVASKQENCDAILKMVNDLSNLILNVKNTNYNQEESRLLSSLQECYKSMHSFIENHDIALCNKQILVVDGPAGIGKSHTMANLCTHITDEYISLLILGEIFVDDISPWDKICNEFNTQCKGTNIIEELDSYSKVFNKRVLIVIDAINEGNGKKYWKTNLLKFLSPIKEKDFKVIITVRSDYRNQIFSLDFFKNKNVGYIRHEGFKDLEFDAIKEYCNYYNLNKPVFPYVYNIYENPLILKITCENLKDLNEREFPKNYTYEFIFDNFLARKNRDLSMILDYNERNDMIDKVLLNIVSSDKYEYGMIEYDVAQEISINTTKLYLGEEAKKFLDQLISLNIFNYCSYKDEYIKFGFEILGDYCEAKSIVREIRELNKEKKDILENSSKLKHYLQDGNTVQNNQGMLSILGAILPNQLGIELYSIVKIDDSIMSQSIMDIFIESLIWRNHYILDDTNKKFINKNLKTDKQWRRFLIVLVRLSILDFCDLNAHVLMKILNSFSLKELNYLWTITTAYDYDLLSIIDWIWENAEAIENEMLLNISIVVTWCMSSTKRIVRDHATKALTNILIRNPKIVIELFDLFKYCKDDYVIERLLASMYGAQVHTNKCNVWKDVAEIVYDRLYNSEESFPNIVVRMYSRLLLESISLYNGLVFEKKYPKCINTKSKWYDYMPTNEDIDKFIDSIKNKYGNNSTQYYAAQKIVNSMITEYGRGRCGYGDFGRYVFGYNVKNWDTIFNDQDLSNIVISQILTYQYDFELFSEFDTRYAKQYFQKTVVERIGKKYQWIGMHQILARLVDNFPPYKNNPIYSDKMIEQSNEFEELDGIITHFSVKKNVASYEKVYIYNPEIETYLNIHEIDPTYIWKSRIQIDEILSNLSFESICNVDLSSKDINLKNDQFRFFEYNNRKYINIYAMIQQTYNKEKNYYLQNGYTWYTAACLVEERDLKEFKQYYRRINNNGIPVETHMNLYLYSFFRSFIYQHIKNEWSNDRYDPNHTPLVEEYCWELNDDDSTDENGSISLVLPSQYVVNVFDLEMKNPSRWYDKDGNLVCFITGNNNNVLLYVDLDMIKSKIMNTSLHFLTGEYFRVKNAKRIHETWQYCEYDLNTKLTEITVVEEETFTNNNQEIISLYEED